MNWHRIYWLSKIGGLQHYLTDRTPLWVWEQDRAVTEAESAYYAAKSGPRTHKTRADGGLS